MGDHFNDVNTVKNVSKVIFVNMGLSDKFRPPQANGNKKQPDREPYPLLRSGRGDFLDAFGREFAVS